MASPNVASYKFIYHRIRVRLLLWDQRTFLQVGFHYMDTGFPYTTPESFMNLFEGFTYREDEFSFPPVMQDQENAYWAMPMGFFKFGQSGPGSSSYNGYGRAHVMNDHVSVSIEGRRNLENLSVMNPEEPETLIMHGGGSFGPNSPGSLEGSLEECIWSRSSSSSQAVWQDDINPDNMTYEELLDLGEAVGTHSRGLSQELILSLPISKYKPGSIFSRKKSHHERCVICQMEYKRRDHQMTLPCKHVYHAGCGAKWLSINKACPICYAEVFGEDSKR